MPTILRIERLRFFFCSLENGEPPHVHIERGDGEAKFWLDPVGLARSSGFRAHALNRLRALVVEHRAALQEAWHEHFRR